MTRTTVGSDTKTGVLVGGKSDKELDARRTSPRLTEEQGKAGSAHSTMTIGVGGQTIKAEGDVKFGTTFADTSMSMTWTWVRPALTR